MFSCISYIQFIHINIYIVLSTFSHKTVIVSTAHQITKRPKTNKKEVKKTRGSVYITCIYSRLNPILEGLCLSLLHWANISLTCKIDTMRKNMNSVDLTSLKTTIYGLHNFFYFYKVTIWPTKFLVDAEVNPQRTSVLNS